MPQRIQRRRTKGWRMPENCIYVGRPGRWGNPFTPLLVNAVVTEYDFSSIPSPIPGRLGCESVLMVMGGFHAELCVLLFRHWIHCWREKWPEHFEAYIAPLRGKDLACWCGPNDVCHADVLLELANA